jgi:non-canonical (house-cleaning) NTP pyrophosphatase
MIKIAIGTNSAYKINAIRKALYELDFEFTEESTDVDSGISEQPKSQGETIKGSVNRAQNALKNLPTSDIGIGVEFGYEPIDDRYHMVCWASIVTKNGKVFSEQSSTLELPKVLREALINGKDVSDTLDEVFAKLEDKERNRIFKQYLKKRRAIHEAVTNVTLRFLLDETVY